MGLPFTSLAWVLAGLLLIPSVSAAQQLRLTFVGTWQFYDGFEESPDYWNAMNASGVFEGSPMMLSLVVSDADANADARVGSYPVVHSQLRVGRVVLNGKPTSLDVFNAAFGSDALMIGEWVGRPSDPFRASYLQFSYSGPVLPSDQLRDLLPELAAPDLTMFFVGYTSESCGLCLGYSRLRLVAIDEMRTSKRIGQAHEERSERMGGRSKSSPAQTREMNTEFPSRNR